MTNLKELGKLAFSQKRQIMVTKGKWNKISHVLVGGKVMK